MELHSQGDAEGAGPTGTPLRTPQSPGSHVCVDSHQLGLQSSVTPSAPRPQPSCSGPLSPPEGRPAAPRHALAGRPPWPLGVSSAAPVPGSLADLRPRPRSAPSPCCHPAYVLRAPEQGQWQVLQKLEPSPKCTFHRLPPKPP